jgi:RND family efflux transporter MFP subunit
MSGSRGTPARTCGQAVATSLLLASLAAALAACQGVAAGDTAARPGRRGGRDAASPAIVTITPEAVENRTTWEVRGVLEPARTAGAAFILGGRMTKVLVARGDRVTEGQVLAQLDTAEVGAGVAQTRAAVAAATAQVKMADDALGRLERLTSEHAVAESKVVEVRLQREAAAAMLAQAQAALLMASVKNGQHVLRAPMAGTVLEVPERVGEIVGPGIPQFQIADLDRLRVRGSLPGEAVGRIVLGQEVPVRVRASVTLSGRISYISPALTADSHRLPFEIEVTPPTDQRDGLANAYVSLDVAASSAVTVARLPTSAIVRGDESAVFVVGDDRIARRRVVTIVRNQGDHVLVEGLEPGVAVVDLPPIDLVDGARVER